MPSYDAFLLVSFGGPEGPADVMPFLENVTRGRGVPPERLAEVAHHYHRFGGVSPINQHCRDLLAAIEKEFAATGLDLPVYWGNRNWRPFLADTVAAMAADGVRRAIAFVTSAYGSYSSCRQYLDDIESARASVGPAAPAIDKIRHFCHESGFIEPLAESAAAALARLPAGSHLVFTAHSVPDSMAASSGPSGGLYPAQLKRASALVTARVEEIVRTGAAGQGAAGQGAPVGKPDSAARAGQAGIGWRLVYQSRSGPPSAPWLGPDVCDHIEDLAGQGVPGAVLVPVGFVCDHMEVVYDLDVEAAELAERLGFPLARAATPGAHPRFVSMVADLVRERLGGGGLTPTCGEGCCPRPSRPGSGR